MLDNMAEPKRPLSSDNFSTSAELPTLPHNLRSPTTGLILIFNRLLHDSNFPSCDGSEYFPASQFADICLKTNIFIEFLIHAKKYVYNAAGGVDIPKSDHQRVYWEWTTFLEAKEVIHKSSVPEEPFVFGEEIEAWPVQQWLNENKWRDGKLSWWCAMGQ